MRNAISVLDQGTEQDMYQLNRESMLGVYFENFVKTFGVQWVIPDNLFAIALFFPLGLAKTCFVMADPANRNFDHATYSCTVCAICIQVFVCFRSS